MHIDRDLHHLGLRALVPLELQHLERDNIGPEYAPQRTRVRQQRLEPTSESVVFLQPNSHPDGSAKIGKGNIRDNIVVLEFFQVSAVAKYEQHAEARDARRDGRDQHPERHWIHRSDLGQAHSINLVHVA